MATSNAAAEAERDLRLRAEELIAGAESMPPDEALAVLAEVEARALALAGAGLVRGQVALGLVVATVDALAVRRVGWLEPTAADLDVARLHEAVGSSRPQLRSVVAVPSGCVAVWDDRVEARLVGAAAIAGTASEIADLLGVDVASGVEASVAEVSRTSLDAPAYLAALTASCAGEARRNAGDLDHLNRVRRRLVAAVDALGEPDDAVGRFDALVASLPSASATSALVEVVPLARRFEAGWLLALERWTDHWRLHLAGPAGRGRWTAVADEGSTYGGVLDEGVVRFDPALTGSRVAVTWIADGAPVAETFEVEVER